MSFGRRKATRLGSAVDTVTGFLRRRRPPLIIPNRIGLCGFVAANALCHGKLSEGVREFAQVIKKDAAISVGRGEFRCVPRGMADRWSFATRRDLGCRHNRRGGYVGAPGCFLAARLKRLPPLLRRVQ